MPGLDKRQMEAGHAERAAGQHRGDEGGRPEPERAAADQRRPEADGHHGEEMVGAAERVHEAGHEGRAGANVRMREGRRGEQRKGDGQGKALHQKSFSGSDCAR